MSGLWRFAVYNLGASLLAGLFAWGLVLIALRLLRARAPFLYASFLALPLVKSIFVLAGLGWVLPGTWLAGWHRQAVPPQTVLPFVLLWFAAAWAVVRFFAWRARTDLLRTAITPSGADGERLQCALARVGAAYQKALCCEAGETVCCASDCIPTQPRLYVSERLRSPVALVEGGIPTVIFPRGLVSQLDDTELALALAHELNHFALRKPGGWSAGNLRLLALVSPVALLLADALHREEEKACDDMAVRILGMPEVYAGMLTKSYRFARKQRILGQPKPLMLLPQLIGARPFLSERIERLLEPQPAGKAWFQTPLVSWPVWAGLLYLLFFARIGA